MSSSSSSSSPVRTTLTIIWAALNMVQLGLHATAFNGVQSVVTCMPSSSGGGEGIANLNQATSVVVRWYPKDCVSMTTTQFGVMVAVNTIGSLLGCLMAGTLERRFHRVGTLVTASWAFLFGSILVGISNTVWSMTIGRIVVGFGSGLAGIGVPLYLLQIAPPNLKRAISTLNQFSIVIGLLLGLCLSFPWAAPFKWRYIFLVPTAMSVIQLVASPFVREGKVEEALIVPGDEEAPLIIPSRSPGDKLAAEILAEQKVKPMSIWEVLSTKDTRIRRGLIVVIISAVGQQLSGTSGVMYFTTRILSPVFPKNSRYVSAFVLLFKLFATGIPAFIVGRFGAKRLILFSIFTTALSCVGLAIGLNTSASILSVLSILAYVLFYSLGLGPLLWVIFADVVPPESQTAAGSIAAFLSSSANFAVGATFLPLQEWLAGPRGSKEGEVFFVFAATMAATFVALRMAYKWQEGAVSSST